MARGVLLLVLALLVAAAAAAAPRGRCVETFPVAGLKCNLKNRPIDSGEGITCPEGKPSTVTFCKRTSVVRIVGNFAAADLGVCDPKVNPYTLPKDYVVKYEQYGDQVVFRIVDREPGSMFRCLLVGGERVCGGFGFRNGVSYLTGCVPVYC